MKRIIKKIFASILSIVLVVCVAIAVYFYLPVGKYDKYIEHNNFVYNGIDYVEYAKDYDDKFDVSCFGAGYGMLDNCILVCKGPQTVERYAYCKYKTLSSEHDRKKDIGYYKIGDLFIFNSREYIPESSIFSKKLYRYYCPEKLRTPDFTPENIESLSVYCGSIFDCGVEAVNAPTTVKSVTSFIANDWSDDEATLLIKNDDIGTITSFVEELQTNKNLNDFYNKMRAEYKRDDIFFRVDFKDSDYPFSLLFTEKAITNEN